MRKGNSMEGPTAAEFDKRNSGKTGLRMWLRELEVGVPAQVPAAMATSRESLDANAAAVFGAGGYSVKKWHDGSFWVLRRK